jgi:hypothetical protein
MPKLPRPRIILKQVEELKPENQKGEIVYLTTDKHAYLYQHEG